MRIILSPAKQMKYDDAGPDYMDLPVFLESAGEIRDWLKARSYDELKKLWACNDKIAAQNVARLADMDLNGKAVPPCGACRELMAQLMPEHYKNIEIMMDYEKQRVCTLGELTPQWWV